ncbi:intermembrane transport protein PqiB [Aliikangiella sp. IMCC44653]
MQIENNIEAAEESEDSKLSAIWLVPLVAVLIGSWMFWYNIATRGAEIKITFDTAEGIEIDTTKIKLRDITVGKVTDLELAPDLNQIILTARLNKDTDKLLKSDTQFWVVKPRVARGGISGLTTILSGAYIELTPGTEGEYQTIFKGLEHPPVTPAGTPGLHITLDSDGLRAMDVGDPILFKGIQVGQIEYVHFNPEERVVYYDTFIESPYDKLITKNTRFWEINGVELDMSADGFKMQTGTLETMLGGGVAFDVPANLPRGEVVTERAYFTIYPNKDAVREQQYRNAQPFILLFKQSIRGLKPGAPVEYKGIRLGSVVRTDINYPEMGDLLDQNALIPVQIKLEPARLGLKDSSEELSKVITQIESSIGKGLHGFLSTGSLLTGSKYIELQFVDGAVNSLQTFGDISVIPTAASELDNLLVSMNNVLSKLEKLPLNELLENASQTLQKIGSTADSFAGAGEGLSQMLHQPESQHLIRNINQALQKLSQVAEDYAHGSKTQQDLGNMLNALEQALKDLSPVLHQLQSQPNSLIFSGSKKQEPQPKAKNKE